MSKTEDDTGVVEALLERLNDFRLPRLLELKERVDGGETLTENDIELLERVLKDAHSIHALIDRRPDVQPLYARVTALHNDISKKAVENEGRQTP